MVVINDLSELQKFLKLCRKQGVSEIKFAGIEIKFGELPKDSDTNSANEADINAEIDKAVGLEPGFEDYDPMAFYSSRSEQ